MSGGLLPAKRTVSLSTYSRNGTCCFLILTFGFFASNALMSSVQYSPAPGSSICHDGKFELDRLRLRSRATRERRAAKPDRSNA